MSLSDSQLGMLEQLTYINGDVAEAAGVSGFPGVTSGDERKTVGEILARFDEEALKKLESNNDCVDGARISGKEWAATIRYLKESDLSDYVLADAVTANNGKTDTLVFTESPGSKEAVVAFRGTLGEDEWADNVKGLNMSDTPAQRRAADYIESLPYDSITVTGHSKGANKAMYVAVTCDKVDNCVAFDGQGFSQEFIDKYWAEINAKAGKIKNYSLDKDFVHCLMFPIPGSEQIYCQGYGLGDGGQYHSPNSFFKVENGRLVLDANGNPRIDMVALEDPNVEIFHRFTTFILNNANDKDQAKMISFLAEIARLAFPDEGKIDMDKIYAFISSNPATLSMVLAYLVKFMKVNNLKSADVSGILEYFKLDELKFAYAAILDVALHNMGDGDRDFFLRNLAQLLGHGKLPKGLQSLDITRLWMAIEAYYNDIDDSHGTADARTRGNKIMDFSIDSYNAIMESIAKVAAAGSAPVSSWSSYSSERWYNPLMVGLASLGICTYFERLQDVNSQSKERIEAVYAEVEAIDTAYAGILDSSAASIKSISASVRAIADSIKT